MVQLFSPPLTSSIESLMSADASMCVCVCVCVCVCILQAEEAAPDLLGCGGMQIP